MPSSRPALSARTSRRNRRSNSPDMPAGEAQPGLRALVQKRLLDDVFQKTADQFPGWKILVVDEHSMRVISASIGMYDIMEKKVTLVESLEKKRAPFGDMGVIYLLEPTAQSVSKMMDDFVNGKFLYGDGVFLFFLGRLPDKLLDQIKTCRPLLKRLKTLSEINIDFLAKEERAFNLDMRNSFPSFYLRNSAAPAELSIAEKLVTVCAALNEYPHIRYRQSSGICQSLASIFHLKMDDFVSQNPKWWYHGGPQRQQNGRGERSTLLLLDRADDCLSPLMHDFTYQSMVQDLLPMDGDRITIQSETANDATKTEAKDVLLDERDTLWVELRGMHIAKVIETLSARIREIMNSKSGSALGGKSKGNMSLSQMAIALKALPEYREVMSKLSQHMRISHECMNVFTKQNLLDLSELEQTLATGKDENGRSPKLADMIEQVEDALDKLRNPADRLRLVLITIISQGGLRPKDRRRLMNAGRLSENDMKTVNMLEAMGISVSQQQQQKSRLGKVLGGDRIASGGSADEESEFAASRYIPAFRTILEELANDQLSLETYPSVLPMPDPAPSQSNSRSRMRGSASARSSARSSRRGEGSSARKSAGATSRWSKSSSVKEVNRSTGPTNFVGGRCIVFMVGGMAYSELRVAREVMSKESREIVTGSTVFVNADGFMEDLAHLAQD